MSSITVKKAHQISVEMTVPGDKSISHRAAMLASLSNGTCFISGFLNSEDCLATLEAMKDLGVNIEKIENNALTKNEKEDSNKIQQKLKYISQKNNISLKIEGIKANNSQLKEPNKVIDCKNSGTLIRLLTGVLAGQKFSTKLTGDNSLKNRPMNRIIKPLQNMGASITASGKNGTPPLNITGNSLNAIDYELPIASAQLKSCILLAGLFAKGKTIIHEKNISRNHTEIIFKQFRLKTVNIANSITVYGGQIPEATDIDIPGDISSAAFWIVLSACQENSKLRINNIGLNESRTAFLKVLIRMGAFITEVINDNDGEKTGSVEVNGNKLIGTTIEGKEIPLLIDEIPILAIAASVAEGKTIIRDAEELRKKESDRISTIVTNLTQMGIKVEEYNDGLIIHGGTLKPAKIKSYNDHRIAMSFAIAGLLVEKGETIIEDPECIKTSYPTFIETLELFMTKEISNRSFTPVINSLYSSEKKLDLD